MSARALACGGFAACAALVAAALYFQHVEGLEPCPLCILQRIAFIAAGLVFGACCLHRPGRTGRRVYAGLAGVATLTGAAIAARHVWLQHQPPDRVPECGPGLEFLLETLPLARVIETVLRGSGECAEVSWRLLGLTMPGWSLVWLLALTALAVALGTRRT